MNQPIDPGRQMPLRAALQAIVETRDDRTLVVTNQGSARVWPLLANHRLDFHYNPSTMGGVVSLGLGFALSDPGLHVVVISGDGALTMNLGSLISVAAAGAANLTVVIMDNGIYEVTGGQTIAAREAGVDYAGLAKSVGFPSAFRFDDEDEWRRQAADVLGAPGPKLISLRVARALPEDMATALQPISERLSQLALALQQHRNQAR